jgi:hypothetical protein
MKLFLVFFLCLCVLPQAEARQSKRSRAHFKKVLIVMMENTDYSFAMNLPLFKKLALKGALLKNHFAVAHPSQPNYVALVAGDFYEIPDDEEVNLSVGHIGDLLEAKKMKWKVYAESYPGNCYLGSKADGRNYARKHNPFINFKNIQSNPARCANIVNADQLTKDIQNQTLPEFSFYIPSQIHDGHDEGIAVGAKWLEPFTDKLLNDKKFMSDMLFVITFDESMDMSSNQIYTVLLGNNVKPGAVVNQHTNHYSVLRTIENELGTGNLGKNDGVTTPIDGIWK